MKTTRNEALESKQASIAGLMPLTDDELRAVAGGGEQYFNAYYDVTTGRYVLVPEGQVYAGGGLLVGPARLKS
jgi:hypothetical protein